MADVRRTVSKVCMTVAEVGVTVTSAEVGVTVTEGLSIVRVLLLPKDELSRTDEELSTRTLELDEMLSTSVEFFNIELDLKIPLVLIEVIKLCDFNVDVTKVEFNKGMVVVRLT